MNNAPFPIDNAIILAAGNARRFLPLSDVCPKALLPVRGEVLIERQIRQLTEAGVPEIYLVTGYKKELFSYLADKYPVTLVENPDYAVRNNHSSMYAVKEYLANSYICCCDNYFPENPFSSTEERPYYSALYAQGQTDEWCLATDSNDRICDVQIKGENSWYMFGHVCLDRTFSQKFARILDAEYNNPRITNLMWEQLYMQHIQELTLYIRRYQPEQILEFDSLEELAQFDSFYREHSLESLMEILPLQRK